MSKLNLQTKAILILWVALFLISHLSGFDATNVRSLNWDIVLMLTPVGLLTNFVILPDSYLRPYYFNSTEGPGGFVVALVVLHVCLSVALLFRLRSER